MYLIITRGLNSHDADKAWANICQQAPCGLFQVAEDIDCRCHRYVAHYVPGDGAQAFNACWDALKSYGMALDPEGRAYPTGAFDVTGFSAFLPRFMAEQERRGIVTPVVL